MTGKKVMTAGIFVVGMFLAGIIASAVFAAEPLDRFIISDGAIPGFVTVKQPARYHPESLWSYIDGGALPYLDYGVGDVLTFSGKLAPDGPEIVVDIYDMQNNLGAFGIYSSERFSDFSFIAIGVEGYATDTSVSFWKDRYYVKIFSNDAATLPPEMPLQVAREIENRIKGNAGIPPLFALFPRENRQPKSETYLAKNVLGQDYLSGGFMVSYREGDTDYQLLIIDSGTADEATRRFKTYHGFLEGQGETDSRKPGLGDESFVGNDGWYGLMVFARKGRFIVGSAGKPGYENAVATVAAMIAGLPK